MAHIPANPNKSVFQITRWLGLNESPDGDTGLTPGQAAEMRNFRITREGHLQLRPGYSPVCSLATGRPVRGLWTGTVNGSRAILAACAGHLWRLTSAVSTPQNSLTWQKQDLGSIHDAPTSFFGFARKVYLLTGGGYYVWDGTQPVHPVEGYVPLTVTAAPPSGGGTPLEEINLLTGKRRNRFSPDGSSTLFQLAEADVDEICSINGLPASITWSLNARAGSVSFSAPPPKGVNSVTITYRKGNGEREKVESMRFAELFGGNDSRVFLYGDGSNQAIYSGLDGNGASSAEYFPAWNLVSVGAENTPLNALIRHYDRLLCFKPDGAWTMEYTTVSLATGGVTAAFRLSSINRQAGCDAPGQAQLVNNDPWTLSGGGVYAWPLSNYAVRDERNAQRLSDRVSSTLSSFTLEDAITFDDNLEQEFYIICGQRALVCNYRADAWYYYSNVPMKCLVKVDRTLYFGTPSGEVMEFSRKYRGDCKANIDARWESGSIAFDRSWMRKYSTQVWIGIQPETQALVYLTAESDRQSDYPSKVVSAGLSNFLHASFAHWSFGTNRKPKVIRAKLKVKKAVFYKLILYSDSSSATATIVSAGMEVRYTGNVR